MTTAAKTKTATRRASTANRPPAPARELVRLVDQRDYALEQLKSRDVELARVRRQLRGDNGTLMVATMYLAIALVLVAVVYGKRSQR